MPVVRCAECLTWGKRPKVVTEALHCRRCHNVVCWPDRWAEGPSGQNETPAVNVPALSATNSPKPSGCVQTREQVQAELLPAEPARRARRAGRRPTRTPSRLAAALWCVLWAGVAYAGWLDGAVCVLLGLAGLVMTAWRR